MINRITSPSEPYGPRVEDLKESALDVAATVRETVSRAGQSIKEFTIRQPAQALGLALGMGVFLGWIIKRR